MTPPAGTFLAPVRNGILQFPPPLKSWCEQSGWNLFRVVVDTHDQLTLFPVCEKEEPTGYIGEYESSFDAEGRLWIPAELREAVSLGEQSVMIRLEDGVIRVFLRNVFQTLGFGP